MRQELKKLAIQGFFLTAVFILIVSILIQLNERAKDWTVIACIFVGIFSAYLFKVARMGFQRFRYRKLYTIRQATFNVPRENYEVSLEKLLSRSTKEPEHLLAIYSLYAELGKAVEAAHYAEQAYAMLEQRECFQRTDGPARNLCDFAITALTRGWALQGEFSKAATYLEKQFPSNPPKRLMATWYYFLDQDNQRAKNILLDLLPFDQFQEPDRFMCFYLAYRLLNQTTAHPYLLANNHIVAVFREQANQQRENPYGKRFREIVDDLQSLLRVDNPESEVESC
jgi:hypothetical protein